MSTSYLPQLDNTTSNDNLVVVTLNTTILGINHITLNAPSQISFKLSNGGGNYFS